MAAGSDMTVKAGVDAGAGRVILGGDEATALNWRDPRGGDPEDGLGRSSTQRFFRKRCAKTLTERYRRWCRFRMIALASAPEGLVQSASKDSS